MRLHILALIMVLNASFLNAQQPAKQRSNASLLAGSWQLVSVVNIYPDSSRVYPYGKDPKGLLIFDTKGNYAIQILTSARPRIASGDKNKATPEEYAAMVQGSNAHYGLYSVDEVTHLITFSIQAASFPNWEGTRQERRYTYEDGSLQYVVTQTTQGGQSVVAEVSWRKL